jgi:hypothetical protein
MMPMEIAQLGDVFNGIGVVGLILLFGWLLATGRLATGRELREKDRRINALEKALDTRDQQLMTVFEALPKIARAMGGIHNAVEAVTDERKNDTEGEGSS